MTAHQHLMDVLVDATCREFSVSPHVLLGRGRADWEAGARHALAYSLRQSGLTFTEIGCLMLRDHGTAMNSCRKARYFADTIRGYKEKLERIVTVAVAFQAPDSSRPNLHGNRAGEY